MDALTDPPTQASNPPWTLSDKAFLAFTAVVLVLVSWLGILAHREALKTEGTKRNGEKLAAWITQESAKRFTPEYANAACTGDASPTGKDLGGKGLDTSTEAPTTQPAPLTATWGQCLSYLTTHTDFKEMRNPFTGLPPVFVPTCDPSNHSLVGSIAIDKITANPPGSAIPTVISQLQPTDSIAAKLLLKITVCDKGSYPIKIAELEF